MGKSTDELADALWADLSIDNGVPEWPRYVIRDELRTLAREAAKEALLEAADTFHDENPQVNGVTNWLRARAQQIGE